MAEAQYTFFIDWNNDGDYSDTSENVSSRVLGLRQSISFKYGRDTGRALSAIAPSETQFELNNDDSALSPDNTGSALYGSLEPGKPFLIQATYNSTTYNLFRGFLDNYELNPGRADRSVNMSAIDLLGKLGQLKVSTDLYKSVQTGQAIHYLLDALGWPSAARDIDPGATTVRWWCEDDEDALSALAKLVEAEGPPAMAYVGANGNFVFRDRHHRLIRSASKTPQVTLNSGAAGATTEPTFSDMSYDIGWKDLINEVKVDVAEREAAFFGEVWSSDELYSIAAGDTLTIAASPGDPFYDAVPPEEGTDFTVLSGGIASSTITRTSGKSTEIRLLASADTVIQGLSLRAFGVPVARTIQVKYRDEGSVTNNGVRTMQDANLDWAGRNDAEAIANVIVGQRAERVPVVKVTLNSGNSTRLTQILSRDLSDRIHIKEPEETFLDHDFFIETIEHSINQVGKDHRVTFTCERAPYQVGSPPTYFTFGSASKGFNNGVFAQAGASFSTSVFILDDATQGQLGSNGLGF